MKKYILSFGLGFWVLFSGALSAQAATPTLAVISFGTSDTAQVTVQGDPFSAVSLAYYPSTSTGVPTSLGTIGFTNANGTLTTTMTSRMYGIPSSALAYVTVNNQRSQIVVWPTWGQTALSYLYSGVLPGQSTSYTYSYTPHFPYVYQPQYTQQFSYQYPYNTNSYQYPNTYSYQQTYFTQQPASIYYGGMTASQSTLSLQAGQTSSVTISGGTGQLYVKSTTNIGVVSAQVIGKTLSITALAPGTSTITIGSYGGDAPVVVTVTVSGGFQQNFSPYYSGLYWY